jgi:transposase
MTPQIPFAAFVGIDWADQEHAVSLLAPGRAESERSQVPQQAEALDAWVTELRSRFAGKPVAVCLEQSRGALVYALMKYDGLVLFPINPKQLARYREAFAPSGAKDDPTDAELLCRFVREHHDRLRAWRPDDATTRGLRLLSEQRRHWVEQRTALGNRLLQTLKECFPLALQFLGKHVHAERFLALLARFPSQTELQRASPKQLACWLPKLRRVADDPPRETLDAQRIAQLRTAPPLVTDPAVLDSGRLAVRHLAALLQQLNRTVAEYDAKLAALLVQHPEAELFAALPGAGAALTPRLVAAFGSDRQRYTSAAELQQLSGTAPITVRSGKTRAVLMRRACPRFLRQTFHEFARCSLGKSAWAQAYCAMLRAKGHGFHSAVRALAFKWIRILFRCWQSRQPYDETRYLQQLRQKKSPLVAFLTPKTAAECP